MVLLTMTPSIVEGLETLDEPLPLPGAPAAEHENTINNQEPSLESPAVGKPISHGQILYLWKTLGKKEDNKKKYSLEGLLRGSCVYMPPPPPKPEPSPEYKALMARLRRDEEARAYERMLNPIPTLETFSQRFPNAATAAAFAEVNRPHNKIDADTAGAESSDAAAFKEVNQQLMLVFNFLVSIVGVAATIWMVARWWSTPARVLLTLAGAIVVAVAEVVVYSTFAWRMEQGAGKEVRVREVKKVVNTWVIAGGEKDGGGGVDADVEKEGKEVRIVEQEKDEGVEGTNLRRRNKPK